MWNRLVQPQPATPRPITHGSTSPWLAPRNLLFCLLMAVSGLMFWRPLGAVAAVALDYEPYTHILLIPPIAMSLLYLARGKVFREARYCPPAAGVLVLLGGVSLWINRSTLTLSQNDALSLKMALFVGWCVAAFILCYGIGAIRVRPFPLLFLILMVPIPDFVLERTIWLLQAGSTDMTFLMMKAARVPVERQGFVLSLPGIDIEVAKECSGIRSSLLLLVVGLVLGQLFLQSTWRKMILGLAILPLALVKNGLRIFAISTLGIYVDPSFLNGNLHHHGGILFFAVAVGALVWILTLLHHTETKQRKQGLQQSSNPAIHSF